MTTVLKAGLRLRSAVSAVELIVVRAPSQPLVIQCGGTDVLSGEEASSQAEASLDGEQTLLGKRYADEASGLEVLCVQGGAGILSAAGRPLTVKGAKTLPSSD